MDMFVLYADIAISDRMLTEALAIATLDYIEKNIAGFFLPISVLTNTLRNILYVRQNNTTKGEIRSIVEGIEASKHRCLLMLPV